MRNVECFLCLTPHCSLLLLLLSKNITWLTIIFDCRGDRSNEHLPRCCYMYVPSCPDMLHQKTSPSTSLCKNRHVALRTISRLNLVFHVTLTHKAFILLSFYAIYWSVFYFRDMLMFCASSLFIEIFLCQIILCLFII